MTAPGSKTRRGRVQDNGKCTPTLDTECEVGIVEKIANAQTDDQLPRIRRLTPKECFRLQGFSDKYFERARAVNSDNQLYKQAGNSVTVNVIYEIARRL